MAKIFVSSYGAEKPGAAVLEAGKKLRRFQKRSLIGLALLGLGSLFGCSTISEPGASIIITPASAKIQAGSTQQFTAADSSGLDVTWSATGGTITSAGLFRAGNTSGNFTVTATDNQNTKGTASVTVQKASASVTVSPATAILQLSGTQQFTATDSAELAVTWSATGGTITSTGFYTAGNTAGSFTVTAIDSQDNNGSASIKIQAQNNNVVIIDEPADGSKVSSPVDIHATYNRQATYMKLWIDHVAGKVEQNTNIFDDTESLSAGAHLLQVQAEDASTGTIYTTPSNITVTPSTNSLNYTTWKNDNARTGQQTNEMILTPSNVNSTQFGVKFNDPVDGAVYAQPLYLANQLIGGSRHDVVYVATEHDSVYAFDADSAGAPLWHESLLPSGATTVPQSLVRSTIFPEIGITGTPVIDPSSGTLYVVAESLENSNVVFRLHSLSVTTGEENGGSPVVIGASGWQPTEQMQRPGLLLANGNVYIAFGSHGDHQPFHGWIFAYSAESLAQTGVWNVTPSSSEGAIWMAGSGLAADSSGDVYAMTSNGHWDGISDFSDSFVKLNPNLTTVLGFFTPSNQAMLSVDDIDLGAGGLLLVPDQSGSFPHEIIGCGKYPAIFILNRDNMNLLQEVDDVVGGTTGRQAPDRCFLTPAFWQQNVYFTASNDVIKVFKLDASSGQLAMTPSSQGSFEFVFPGAQPVVSSNGSSNGIVWAVDYSSSAAALHAFDASDVSNEIYRSGSMGGGVKWAVPTVINGKVYVGNGKKITVFGLN